MSGLLASTPARADDVVSYEVVGDADASGADARTVALDDAFARATQTVVRELVAGDVRAARKADLDREIVGHARLWVVGFGVTHDDSHDGRRELTVAVRIDRDKLRARLGQLNVALIGGPDKSRGVVVLVRVTSSTGVEASYGPDAKDDMAALTSLTQAMQHAGLALRHAPTSGAAARGAGELPLDDGEATAMAADAKADLALIAGVQVGDAVPVRGIATTARPVAVHVRMVVPGKPDDARDGNARAAAVGDAPAEVAAATARALAAATADAVPPPQQQLAAPIVYRGDDAPAPEQGVVLVRLPAATPFKLVAAEVKLLAGSRGTTAANVRRVSPAGWVIGVTTDAAIQDVETAARRPPVGGTTVQTKVVADIVEVTIDAGT